MRALHKFLGIRKTLYTRSFLTTLTWISGLLAGVYLIYETSFASLMCSVLFSRISIIGLFVSLVLPLLLSYILLRCFHFYCILPIVFLKAFSFMCCYGSIMIAFGNAGWLVAGMLLFSDCFLVVLLLLLWLRVASGRSCSPRFFTMSYILVSLVIGCFDYLVVSPFASILLNY